MSRMILAVIAITYSTSLPAGAGDLQNRRKMDDSSATVGGNLTEHPAASPHLRHGAEMNMIQLQSLVSQRQTANQMVNRLSEKMSDNAKEVAHNIGD